jgi:predicted metalloprotease with PDZ domain
MIPSPLNRTGISILFLGLSALSAQGQEPVDYTISFEGRAHHEARVEIVFRDLPPAPLQLRMSRTSPGRYALHEFAKNVYSVEFRDGAGRALSASRPDLHQWDVSGHDGTVRVSYTLFGDRADGTYTGIDRSHAHLNMPATFMWARGLEDRPVVLSVRAPEGSGWRVATQLHPTDDPYRFTAPGLDYFLDSPTEVSAFELREWSVPGPRGAQTVRLAVHHEGTPEEVDRYQDMTEEVVRQSEAIFGEMPPFDGGTYTFIACYLPWVSGDGMEHRNSTILTSTGSLRSNALGLLGTVAHEFFHAWNVERIRPATLEPFDFERANVSDVLWFAEGFTSYYDGLILWRGNLVDDDRFARDLGGIVQAVVNGPGRTYYSAAEMSQQAPFVDASVSIDPTNRTNTFISYYTWGAAIGLALDLELRARFPGLTLDDLMRSMWERHGRDFQPYVLTDIRDVLGGLTGDMEFASRFFDSFILGRDVPDYEALLSQAGFRLQLASGGGTRVDAGLPPVSVDDRGATLQDVTRIGSLFHEAGLSRGDRILEVGGVGIRTRQDLQRALDQLRPGEDAEIRFWSRGEVLTASVLAAPAMTLEVVPEERVGGRLSAGQREFRNQWRTAR